MPILKTYIVPHPPLIIPEIGKGEERKILKTIESYEAIAQDIASLKPDTIIVSSPHSTLYSDYFHVSPKKEANGDFNRYTNQQISIHVTYDVELRKMLIEACKKKEIPIGTLGEKQSELDHATMIPLYFINKYYKNYSLIRISPSGMTPLEHYKVGMEIRDSIPKSKRVVWVASGDLSHKLKSDGPYGFAAEGVSFDQAMQHIITSGNFQELFKLDSHQVYKASECGLGSISMMLGVHDGYKVASKMLSYQDTFGVGYMVAMIESKTLDISRNFYKDYQQSLIQKTYQKRDKEDECVSLARKSLEYFINHHTKMKVPDNIKRELSDERAGVFVSLHKGDRLRGCIGTIFPSTECIAEEIIQNAISAGTKDYRFTKVKASELSQIDYSVDVLMEPEPIDSKVKLDIYKYGLIVRHQYKSGVLLPNIDGIDSVDDQIRIAKSKAGIKPNEAFTMERFEVIRHQ